MLPEQFVDLAKLFTEAGKIVPWYRMLANEVAERPLGQAGPFFFLNCLRALAARGPFTDRPVRKYILPLPLKVAAAIQFLNRFRRTEVAALATGFWNNVKSFLHGTIARVLT